MFEEQQLPTIGLRSSFHDIIENLETAPWPEQIGFLVVCLPLTYRGGDPLI